MSLRRKLAAFAIANLLAMPLMSGIVQAQVTTSQDRTVVTLDVTNSCTTQIFDTLSSTATLGVRGDDQELHDEDDVTPGSLGDGFDQVTPSPTNDFSDSDFSNLTVATFDAASSNIVVDDPEGGDNEAADGHGYVDLELFDTAGNQYAAEFNAQVTCDTVNGYDLHIADTFNLNPTAAGLAPVNYCFDIGDPANPACNPGNLARREGLFRIAPDSVRDIDQATMTTGSLKHEFVLDLPEGTCVTDDVATNCAPAPLDPFALNGTREWPYAVATAPVDTELGTVGFTLLCDEDGDTGAATAGTGRINPFSRGITVPTANMFRTDVGNDDCDDVAGTPKEKYAAIPSLVSGADYQGITGTNPATYAAILSVDNWVGYSGTITAGSVTDADNFFEVRASLPNNQIAGTYAGTIILSCLPNLTAEPEADFDGDYVGDDTTN